MAAASGPPTASSPEIQLRWRSEGPPAQLTIVPFSDTKSSSSSWRSSSNTSVVVPPHAVGS